MARLRLKAMMIRAGLTRYALAKRAGLNYSIVWRVAEGQVEPSLTTLRKLSGALGCTVGDLLGERATKKGGR